MDIASYFPIWNKFTPQQQQLVQDTLIRRQVTKGTVVHDGSADCSGLMLIRNGQLRVYMLSEEGREVTLYRLFDMDICLFSASCVMQSVQFDVMIEAEKGTEMEQIMWKSFDKRLAAFLLEEAVLEETHQLKITHEAIGNHLGNPREVVTRMLRYFQSEGMVNLSRGTVEITDEKKLRALAGV